MVEFSSQVLRVVIMTINNKSERNYRGKCLGWPVASYGGDSSILSKVHILYCSEQPLIKDPFSLTVMLCALFVVKRGHSPEQPLLGQFMASDLGNFWRYSQFAAKGRLCKRVWFPFRRNESEQNEDDGATRSETREIQVVCFACIFQTIF